MYKRIYDSDEIMVDLDGRELRISVFEDGHWVDEHFVELPELEPVVHAHWIWIEDELHECSACGGWECFADCHVRNYCPQCGAHMDEEVSE